MVSNPRSYLEREVRERASHTTAEQVRSTCSFARAERLIGREYHGRFLIELLQNAADAWRKDLRSSAGGSRVAVLITEGPALLVANQGEPMAAEVVIESLGHIGASTKPEGEAIGHKGIGFKSVLEITLAPEIYSGLQDDVPTLAVKFDPACAYSTIQEASPDWSTLVSGIHGIDPRDAWAAVPILRFPQWVDALPAGVQELKDARFDTVVRLPFDSRFVNRLKLEEDAWLSTVRDALWDVSDQILLLLGCFSEVRVEDRLNGRRESVVPHWESSLAPPTTQDKREAVRIRRNGALSSQWCLFRRTLPEFGHLAGEIAVGLRLDSEAHPVAIRPAGGAEASAPFHLFFPTRIASGLPFLLHGYFEVDAGRTGFYRGSANRNSAILRELAALTAETVRNAAASGDTDLVSLVNLVAEAGDPEDPLARKFRDDVLGHLDDIPWVPVHAQVGEPPCGRPRDLFVCSPALTRHVAKVFPSSYMQTKVDRRLPDTRLSDRALELVRSRQPNNRPTQWDIFAALCRPGVTPIWQGLEADQGFLGLLDLLGKLEGEDRTATNTLIDELRGDPETQLLPTVSTGGGRSLLPVPNPSEGVPGRRSRLVMARVQTMAGEMLVPPDELDLSFLPDGLLESETDIDRAKPLGVRPFTVDNVLDRLNGIDDMNGIDDTHDDRALLFRFLWGLLHRARESGFGTQHSSERATSFDPSAWFWCRPGRAREDENARLQQQRARYLAAVPVPCRDGKWRTASRVAFGTDWAEWLENGAIGNPTSRAVCQRIQAYHALEKISPGSHALLASPHVLIPYLAPPDQLISNAGADAEDVMDNHQLNAERHAFLLRLGVWEVPPIEAFESRDPRDRKNFPWSDSAAVRQQAAVAAGGGWTFGLDGWSGMRHHNVYLAEDYRFAWPLEELAERDATALMVGLQYGAKLYAERFGALVFCPRCSDSGSSHSRAARHSSALDGYPSLLALQLRYDRWVMYTLDGSALQPPQEPASVWWHQKPPTGAGLRQSAYRFLRLCSPSTEMTDELRRLAGIHTLEDASYEALRSLLPELRLYRDQPPPSVTSVTSGSARQAFVSLHRLVYERLAELAGERAHDVTALLAETGILCEIGEDLVYRSPAEAYHDDGRFATYIRHFLGHIPLAVLARDRGVTADRLGIQPLVIQLARRGNDQGRDVTGELRTMLGDRFSELLSIVVHHSLGTQTLGLTSQQFEVRARRLQALTVRQLDDLVIDASIAGCPFHVTIGEGSGQDLFLENPTAAMPVLFHDLSGDGWQDRVRRKLGPHLATVLENPAYAATFALLLQAETEAEREEYLLGLGISSAEVDAVATHLGVVDAEERRRFARWFLAILRSQGTQRKEYELDLDPEGLVSMLVDAGIPQDVAHCLVDIGGGESVRRDTSKGSALRLLADLGIDPRALDTHLRQLDDPGLSIAVAYQMLRQWLHLHGRQCAVVLATRQPDKVAKAAMQMIEPPSEVVLSIEPALAQVLEPVAALLQTAGVIVPTELLASDPEGQLARAGGFESVADLNQATHLFYSPEERRRALRELAAQWRRELRVLAVLARTGPTETHTRIRAIDETVCAMLPAHPSQPSELRAVLDELFSEHGGLAQGLAELLTDSVPGIVKPRENLLTLAKQHGVAVDCLAAVERALDAPRRDQAREIKRRTERLAEHGLTPLPPVGLQPLSSKPTTSVRSPKKVVAIKVRESHDRRKRELGDEGEQWALAAVLDKFLSADIAMRDKAVDEVVALLQGFEGKPVDAALSHAELVRARDVDDAEFIDALTGLLHVSRHSDAFGFDLIGWLAPSVGAEPQAMCLEVKSSGDGGFHLTSGEWALAKDLHDDDQGDRYAVLVVRRGKDGGVPASLDLLVNPVALVHSGQLRQEVDGYQIAYRSQA